MSLYLTLLNTLCLCTVAIAQSLIIGNITHLGPLHSPDVTGVSRDGGTSVLLNGRITWIFDDTECLSEANQQLGFVSNSASHNKEPNANISSLQDFGIVNTGKNSQGKSEYAIRAGGSVGTGGWIPFKHTELDFNREDSGKSRVAIWPGTNPTAISPVSAFIYAPLVYVDADPEDPSKQYNSRGMTLVSVTAPDSGPVASRVLEILFSGTEIGWGGFAAVLGMPASDTAPAGSTQPDVYLFGITSAGLQVAKVALGDIRAGEAYNYFHPDTCSFDKTQPGPSNSNESQIYLPGSFSAGSILYSPHHNTFLLIYFDSLADSTFQIRYLDLLDPTCPTESWIKGGKRGDGISSDDAEALVRYRWSTAQLLYAPATGGGGFNYDGFAHPEFFNRQYYTTWVSGGKENEWYGAGVLPEEDAGGDGKHLLLSWTSQETGGNYGDGNYYQVIMAKVEFGNSDLNFGAPAASIATTTTQTGEIPSATSHKLSTGRAVRSKPIRHTLRTIIMFAGVWLVAVATS